MPTDTPPNAHSSLKLLELFKGEKIPSAQDFKGLVLGLENHQLLAKVFLLEGTPYVFSKSPMKYTVFREQVGDQFDVGSQDVCIVGSAKLGFSPSPTGKYGKSFESTSDVDVVVVSEPLFDRGSRQLFGELDRIGPQMHEVRPWTEDGKKTGTQPVVDLHNWKRVKEAIRNFKYQNFNPALLAPEDPLRRDIFDRISSTSGLFLALEPQVFVSKIRTRIFRTWKAAEDYYANSLHQLKNHFEKGLIDDEDSDDESVPDEGIPSTQDKPAKKAV